MSAFGWGRRIKEYRHPPRGDDGGCAEHTVAWRHIPDESDGTGAALPQAGRAHGRRRLGAWAGGGPCRSVAKRHELQAPKLDHHGQRKWTFGVSHLEKWRENDVGTQRPLPGTPTVGIRALGGPKPTSEFVLRVPNLDDDAKRIHGGFILVRAKEGPTSNGGEYCISLHLSSCVGVISCERGSRS
jgi:hypothetical protein